jgi:glutaredoxin/glutathione-dependent peroxiredoxin
MRGLHGHPRGSQPAARHAVHAGAFLAIIPPAWLESAPPRRGFSTLITGSTSMSIQVGDTLPDVEIRAVGNGIEQAHTGALFAGRKVVLFAVPGAFTPTCSNRHLPGYVQHFAEFQKRGVDVMCLAVNDAYVMQAWATSQQVPPELLMLADGNGNFAKAMGLELDGSAYGMGLRARRFALYADNGVVKQLQIEAPGEFRVSSAEAMLELIG